MYRTLASKASLSLEFRAESWSLVQVSGRPVRELAETSADSVDPVSKSAETFVDFVDKVSTSPETFLKSDGTEARTCTYLPG